MYALSEVIGMNEAREALETMVSAAMFLVHADDGVSSEVMAYREGRLKGLEQALAIIVEHEG